MKDDSRGLRGDGGTNWIKDQAKRHNLPSMRRRGGPGKRERKGWRWDGEKHERRGKGGNWPV